MVGFFQEEISRGNLVAGIDSKGVIEIRPKPAAKSNKRGGTRGKVNAKKKVTAKKNAEKDVEKAKNLTIKKVFLKRKVTAH